MGTQVTQGLGAGSQPDVGAAAAQEVMDELFGRGKYPIRVVDMADAKGTLSSARR